MNSVYQNVLTKDTNSRKEEEQMTDPTFDLQTLAADLDEVVRMYTRFFAAVDNARWDTPVKGGTKEWTLHEAIAHLCALNGQGLESIQYALRGEPYTFRGLDNRYVFNAFNRKGIDEHIDLPAEALFAEFLRIHSEAAAIARTVRPDQAEVAMQLPIYNRPVKIVEALSIMMIHAGLFHTAQVAEPAGVPPLWQQLSPEIRHRVIGRTMRAFSLLYRHDIGDPLRTAFAFRVDGPGGGEWYLKVCPESTTSGEGTVQHPGLAIHMRKTDVFCWMLTGRLKLPLVLLSGNMRLSGDLRLFLRMGDLLSVDARPHTASETAEHQLIPTT
jgi:hypothetical protein